MPEMKTLETAVAETHADACDCDVIHEDVVERVRAEMPPEGELVALAELYKMFSDPTRVHLLLALGKSEMCVCDLAALLGVTKSAVSHQLKSLRLANLVRYRREGKTLNYSLADDHVKIIIRTGFEHIRE